MAEELIGKMLDRYKIVSLLGEGGMGAVLKAHDVTLQRDVAIKIMHPHFARRSDFQERFLQEARTAARLDHPGIVKVYDFGRQQQYLYIVMEFLRGDNLRKMLQDLRAEKKWIVLPEALQIIRQVALALAYAHSQGVLHRDIKPDNIMIKPDTANGLPYRPVLTDLGLAKLAGGGMVTQEGTSMGTPAYMSPEQALGQETDARSDVYSLGILLFELATSRLPFPAKTLADAIQYHTRTEPPAPRSLRPDLPVELEQVILKAIAKNPGERFPDAGEMAGALERVIKSLESASTQVASGPTELEGAVSLVTQYQQSLLAARGPSIMEEFQPPSDRTGDGSQDRIQVLAQDRTTTTVNFKSGGMSVGRDPDNDLSLNDKLVSRHHARIEFDGQNYRVVDLNSSNGTFLGETRLLPGVPEPWPADQALRMGNHWLRLLRAQTPARTGLMRPDGTMVDLDQLSKSAGQGRVGVFVEDMQLTTLPGSSLTTKLVLLNQGPVVDHFRVNVQGIPPSWVTGAPPTIRLMPGEQQEVSLTLKPERSPKHRAGRYPITLKVSSQDAPSETAEVRLTLTLGSFSQFSSELFPQKISSGQTGRITIHNQGNTQESYHLQYKDRAGELAFTPPGEQLRVQEGQSATAEFKAAPKQRRWIGGSQSHAFTAQITAASGGESQTQTGEIVSRGLIPTWAIPLLALLCLCLAGGAYLFFNSQIDQVASATQTAEAELTLVAQIVNSTAAAKTATAEFIAAANQATLQAVTATAQWLALDDDVDGLTNQQEIELGTLPGVRDTDQDGLSDGDEVARGTDPLKDDTDGDGLKDGVEVSQGLDPLKPDTDGDGIPDNQDSAPLATSTGTPDAAGTAQAQQAAAATQTAIAQQTAQAAAQTAQAGTALAAANATAQSLTQTAAAHRRIAVVYNSVPSSSDEIKTLLESNNYQVDLIPKGLFSSGTFAPYDLIIVAWDTAEGGSWGTPEQVNAINLSGLPIIAMGESGYDFLGQIGLAIGAPNGWHGKGTAIAAENTGSSFWSQPFNLTPSDNMDLYVSVVNYAAIYLAGPIGGVNSLGRQVGDASHYQILTQGRYMLWGFELGPGAMTGTGKRLFVNAVKFMLP